MLENYFNCMICDVLGKIAKPSSIELLLGTLACLQVWLLTSGGDLFSYCYCAYLPTVVELWVWQRVAHSNNQNQLAQLSKGLTSYLVVPGPIPGYGKHLCVAQTSSPSSHIHYEKRACLSRESFQSSRRYCCRVVYRKQ